MPRLTDLYIELEAKEASYTALSQAHEVAGETPEADAIGEALDDLSDEITGVRSEIWEIETDQRLRESASDRAYGAWVTR